MPREVVPIDLRSVIDDAVNACAQVARNRRINLVVAYPPVIPRRFRGDTAKIRHVMMDLVGNGVRSTSSAQVLVTVACEARRAQHAQMRVSVICGGIGVSPERIGPSESSGQGPQGGAGIELVVSKKMLELMGGQLHVESQVDQGSKFWFELPLAVEDVYQ